MRPNRTGRGPARAAFRQSPCVAAGPRGFSLVELLVVTAIAAVVMALAVPSMAAMLVNQRVGAVTPAAWLMGEEVWTPGTPGDALRYMDNPARDQYSSDHTAVMQPCTTPTEENDYCYVHGNWFRPIFPTSSSARTNLTRPIDSPKLF